MTKMVATLVFILILGASGLSPTPLPSGHPSPLPSQLPTHPTLSPSSPKPRLAPTPLPDEAKEPTLSPALQISPTRLPTLSPVVGDGCNSEYISDAYCDEENNIAECSWDGGDCCPKTCVDSTEYECGTGINEFDCKDPSAISPPTAAPTHNPSANTEFIGADSSNISATTITALAVITVLLALGLGCFYFRQKSANDGDDGRCLSNLFGSSSSSSPLGRRSGGGEGGGGWWGSKKKGGFDDDARAVELARFERMSQGSGNAYPNPNASFGTGNDDDSVAFNPISGSGRGKKKGGVRSPLGGQNRWPKNAEDSASLI